METTGPFSQDPPAHHDAIRPQLHALIESFSDELCTRLLAFLREFREKPAPPPPAGRGGQDSARPGPRP